jgi:hypothetical protein
VVVVTCYFRHLSGVFEKAGINVTKENRKEVGRIVEGVAGGDMDCPAVWRQIKTRLDQDEAGFIYDLKAAWENRTR